jgi:hypothetical protein
VSVGSGAMAISRPARDHRISQRVHGKEILV